MRHTLFVVLGENTEPLVLGIRRYVDSAKMGVGAFFRILHYSEDASQTGRFLECQNGSLTDVASFGNDGRQLLLRDFFEKCQRKQVTADNPGDSPIKALHICFILPTHESRSLGQLKEFIEAIDYVSEKVHINFQVDVFLFASDMAYLFEHSSDDELAKKKDVYRETSVEVIRQLVDIKKKNNDISIILMQNSNAKGASLNLTNASLSMIVGEYALLAVCNYDILFSSITVPMDRPIYALGLAILEFQEDKAEEEVARQACLDILNRESVFQSKVDVNKITEEVVKEVLRPHLRMFTHIFEKTVMPRVEKRINQETIMAEVSPEIKEKLDLLKSKCLSFFDDDSLSLPEKEAALSKLLGNDDPIFEGDAFDRHSPVFEDCFNDAMDFYVRSNKKLSQDEDFSDYAALPMAEGIEIGSFGELRGIVKANEEVIRQESDHIRKKTRELDATMSLLDKESDGEQDDGKFEVDLDRDSGITRTEMIAQNIEEKKQSIEDYRNLRNSADTLSESIVQTLGDSRIREKICEGMQKKLDKDKTNLETKKAEKEQERRSALKEINEEKWLIIRRYVLSWVLYVLALAIPCVVNGSADLLTSKFALITYIALSVSILIFAYMLYRVKRKWEETDERYQDELNRLAKKIADLNKEKEVVKLKGLIAGMFIDHRNILSAELEKKNIDVRDMTNRLRDWHASLLKKVMPCGTAGQFISLVIKSGLEKFFKKQKSVVTGDVFLHRILKESSFAGDSGFAKLVGMLKQNLTVKLQSQFGSFSLFQFLEKKTDFDYLDHDDVNVKQELKKMDELSEVFLIKRDLADEDARNYAKKILFMKKPQDESGEFCRESFLEKPNLEYFVFPNKATLIRLEALSENEIALMGG